MTLAARSSSALRAGTTISTGHPADQADREPAGADGLPAHLFRRKREFYTAAALGLLAWWVDQDFPHDPATLATMYHRLAVPGILAALGGDHR
jgi:hypothetical protein